MQPRKRQFDDSATVLDMLSAAERVREKLVGVSFESFDADLDRKDIVAFQFARIGEASRRLSAETKARYPAVPWLEVESFRHVLIHEYDQVDYFIVWEIAQNDLPQLIGQLRAILATFGVSE